MNYAFLKNLNQRELQKFLWYIRTRIMISKKHNWLTEMAPIWKEGRHIAEQHLEQLNAQNTEAA